MVTQSVSAAAKQAMKYPLPEHPQLFLVLRPHLKSSHSFLFQHAPLVFAQKWPHLTSSACFDFFPLKPGHFDGCWCGITGSWLPGGRTWKKSTGAIVPHSCSVRRGLQPCPEALGDSITHPRQQKDGQHAPPAVPAVVLQEEREGKGCKRDVLWERADLSLPDTLQTNL